MASRPCARRSPGEFENPDFNDDANLAFLGDIFAIPEAWPLSNVFGIGDRLIVVGGTWFAHVWCRREHTSNVWPAPSPGARVVDEPVPVG